LKLHLQVDTDTVSALSWSLPIISLLTYLFIFLFTNGLVISINAEALYANVEQVFMRYNTPIPSSAAV